MRESVARVPRREKHAELGTNGQRLRREHRSVHSGG